MVPIYFLVVVLSVGGSGYSDTTATSFTVPFYTKSACLTAKDGYTLRNKRAVATCVNLQTGSIE